MLFDLVQPILLERSLELIGCGLELALKIVWLSSVVFELVQMLQIGSITLYVKVPVQHTQISVSANQYSSPIFSLVKHFTNHIEFFLLFSIVFA